MNHLPGYDNWKLASPPESPDYCVCGHEASEHYEDGDFAPSDDWCRVSTCDCAAYSDEPSEPDPDRRYDLEREQRLE